MKFLSSLVLLILSASFAAAQASPKSPEVKTGVRTITHLKKKVVISRRTEHVKISVKHASAAYLAQLKSMAAASKSLSRSNVSTVAKTSTATAHPRYGGPSTTIVDAQSFGGVNTGGQNSVKTFTYSLPTGDSALSFAMEAGKNFSIQTSSCNGVQCTAQVAFAPQNPGLLIDAVSVTDSSSNLVYQTFVSGNGLGPQFGFMFGNETDYYDFASYPTGTAWGPDGTFYVIDGSDGVVSHIAFGGNVTSFQLMNVCNPAGIAVDGAGTVYVADPMFNQVVAYSSAGVQTVVQTTPLLNPTWVAVDGTGALYISDTGNGRIIKLDNHNIESTVLTGLNAPAGMAVDGNGNLYFADQDNGGEIKELMATTQQVTSIGTEFGSMQSISLDAAGDVYFTTSELFGVFDQATGDTYTQNSNDDGPFSVAVSPNGDILSTQARDGFFRVLDVSSGNFGLETQIQSTATGQLTIANTGNSNLSFSSLAVGGPAYRIDPSTVCNTDSSLPPGNACVVNLDFTPPAINSYQDTFTATSNSLNISGTQNNFALSGAGDGAYTYTTLSINPQSATLGANVTFTAAVNSDSSLPSPTGTVNFLEGDSQLGSANLTDGSAVFTTNSLSAGTHNVTAYYTGDSNNSSSSSYMNSVTVGIGSTGAGTSLSVSSANISLNQAETLTVTVSADGTTPTGTVMFMDGGNTLGTATLSGSGGRATASLTVSNLSGGSHGIFVSYSGDQNYSTGTSNTQTVTVAQGMSATTLSISPSSPDTEEGVTLTANVTSGTNPAESGLVIFSDQNGTIGYASIQPNDTGGTASYNTVLSAGSHQVIANFTQDTNYADSISASQTVIVSQGTPYINLNVSAANIKAGQTEILTLQLGDGDAFGEPGTVTFSDQNGTLGSGVACSCYRGGYSTLQLTNLSPGVHYITGTYNGDSNYSGTTSSPQTVTVSGASAMTTTTSLTVSASSITVGQSETLTATISGGSSPAETGTVTFADQNGTIGSVSVTATDSGSTASLSLESLSAGTHQITATYSGDSNYGSSVSAAQTVTVTSGSMTTSTTTALTVSNASPTLGSSVTFTATVSANGSGPSGSVTFSDQNGAIVSANLAVGDSTSTAIVTYSSLTFGSHQITATYNGNTRFGSSTSSAQTVTVGPATSTTSLTVSPAATTAGQTVTLTGTVQSYPNPALNGVISFADQNGGLGFTNITPNSSGGTASLTLTNLSVGVHQITAAYNNDYEHAYSISPAQTVTISAAPATATTTTLTVPPSATYKSPVTLSATVTPVSGVSVVVGQVIFCAASAPRCVPELSLATAQVNGNGSANVRLSPGTIGAHSYVAKFLGTTTLAASTSTAQAVVVAGTYSTSTTISSSGAPGNYAITGTVVGLGSRTVSPTGTVTFNDLTNTSNPPLGNPTLGSGTVGFTAVSAAGSPNKTGAGSYGVASGDFNRDGFMDIAVENYSSNTVSVLLGNGDGTFQTQVSYAVGSSPERVLVADFNGDGIPDLVVANTGSSTVSILLGNGDGTFQPQVTYGAASPVGLGVMDLNHDGIADLVVGDYYANTMSVLLGNGDGTFKTAVTYATGGTPQTLAEGDFNGDGNIDIAVGNLAGNTVGIFLGNGDGTFQAQVTYPVGRAPQGVQVGDFNSDGFDDLAVSNSTDNTISILLGNGDGTFKTQVTYPVGADPVGLVVADFNGDGKQDLSVGNTAQSALTQSILLGNGDGTFQPQITVPTGNFPYGEVAADFNGDGFPDLAISNFSDATATILLSQVTETATATVTGITVGPPTGTHSVNASYSGDNSFGASTSSTISLTNSALAPTVTNLSETPSTQTALQYVSFVVTVAGTNQSSPAPTGTITFSNLNGTPALTFSTASLPGGNVTVRSPSLAAGAYSIVATYSGDTVYAPSVSATIPLTINAITTATTLTTSAASIVQNQTETLTASIPSAPAANSGTGASYGPIAPTGTITFADQNGVLGTMTLTGASTSSSAVLALSTLSAGAHQIVAKYSGDKYYAASTSPAQTVTVTPVSTGPTIDSKTFGNVPLAGTPSTVTLTYTAPAGSATVTAATAIGTVFNAQAATCGNGVCSVQVTFTPTYPGLATDALTVTDANGNLLDKTFLYGTGTAPQLGYNLAYGIFSTFSGTLKAPASVAVGPDANLYVGDIATNQVYKIAAGTYGGGTALAIQGLGKPGGIAVSGDGTVYVADQTNNLVRSFSSINSSQSVVTTTALAMPNGVAVDGTGAIYISDTGHGRIIKIDNQGSETTVATGLSSPGGLALDAAGDLFYADSSSGGEITEISVAGGSTISVGKNLGALADIAVAPSGRVYFATTKSVSSILNGTVYSNGYFNLNGNPVNYGMALDRFQDIITTNTTGGVLVVTNRTASSFTFGTPVGTTNTCCDSIENTGNSPLTVASVVNNGANYALHSGGGECVAAQVLQPTQTCNVVVDFSPTAFQNYPDTVTVTSNSRNISGSTNTSSLLETGQQIPTTVSLAVSPNPARAGQTITFTATLAFTSTYATSPSGTMKFLNADGSTLASVPVTGLTTQYTTSALGAGSYSVTASYSGDTAFVASASSAQAYTVVALTPQSIIFPAIPNHLATDAPFTLNATASSELPVSYTVTAGPATVSGATVTLTGGTGTVTIQATQAGNTIYAAATPVLQSFNVTLAAATLTSVSPNNGALGSAATTVTLTGTNFNTGDVVQLNGATISSTYASATSITAVIPASFFAQTGTGLITVFDPVSKATSGSVTFTVNNAPQIVFTGPSTSTSGAQPSLTFQLVNPYPVALSGVLTLSFTPVASAGVNDPAVQFATGGRTLAFNIPANSTVTPSVLLQTGTVAGVATITLAVNANGVNVTPTSVTPVVITIPPAAPTLTSTSVTRNGNTLTVTMVGFSNTRETTQATFHFTAVAGATINNPDVTVTVTPTFASYYSGTTSLNYGSAFTYAQPFTLDQDSSIVQSVTVTLANTIGTSATATTP